MSNDVTRNMLVRLCQAIVLVTGFLCMSAAAVCQSVLTDDAHTSSVTKDIDSNFGTNPNLFVSATNIGYLKFKLTPTLPTGTVGSDVSKATLKIYIGNVSVPGTVDVVQVADNWSEKTITARTAPALADLIATGVSIDASRKGQYLLIDVTNAVKNWLDTSNNCGLALVGHDGTSVTFDSKENSQTGHEPELIVALNSRMGPQGPQGSQGEQGEKGETGATGAQGPGELKVHREPQVHKVRRVRTAHRPSGTSWFRRGRIRSNVGRSYPLGSVTSRTVNLPNG